MKRIESKLNTASSDFQANAAHNRKLAEVFKEKQRKAREDRPQRDVDRLRAQNKLLVRERLQQLLDPGTPFLEFSSLAANILRRRPRIGGRRRNPVAGATSAARWRCSLAMPMPRQDDSASVRSAASTSRMSSIAVVSI